MELAKSKWRAPSLSKVKLAARSRLVLAVGAFALGAAVSVVALGRPALLGSEHSADWASALASFAAAIVALGLGLYAARQDGRRERSKVHGAALVFFNNVSETLALLEIIEDNKESIATSKAGANHLQLKLLELQPLLSSEVLEFLPHLPAQTAKLVVMSAQRVTATKQRLSIDRSHQDLAAQLEEARIFLATCFLPLGNQLFSEIFGSGLNPPWRDPNRLSKHEA